MEPIELEILKSFDLQIEDNSTIYYYKFHKRLLIN